MEPSSTASVATHTKANKAIMNHTLATDDSQQQLAAISSGFGKLQVYEITTRHVQVRSEPNEEARIDNYILHRGQMVAAFIVEDNKRVGTSEIAAISSRKYKTGPFLRLADGSGYIFEKKAVGAGTIQQTICEPRPLERDEGIFYVHPSHEPSVQRHPDVSATPVGSLDPLQRVLGDASIRHNDIRWYHVISPLVGWVCLDAKSQDVDDANDSISTHSDMEDVAGLSRHDPFDIDTHTLIPESCIQFGLFAFTALEPVAVRVAPTVSEASRTSTIIPRGDLALATVCIRSLAGEASDGPFLYLPKLGWVFERKKHRQIMQKVHLEEGNWSLQLLRECQACSSPVLSGPRSNAFRHRFVEGSSNDEPTRYGSGTVLSCDLRVISRIHAATFYRIQNHPFHWICFREGSHEHISVVQLQQQGRALERNFSFSLSQQSKEVTSVDNSSGQEGWTEEFVKGVAALMQGVTAEIGPEPGKLVFMKNMVKIQIECQARLVSVQTNSREIANFPACSSEQLSSILQDPVGASETADQTNATKATSPVHFSGQLSMTLTEPKHSSVETLKSIILSQIADLEQEMAHYSNKKRELENALKKLENGDSLDSGAIAGNLLQEFVQFKVPGRPLKDIKFHNNAGSLVSTEGSRTLSQGSTTSIDSRSNVEFLMANANEVNLVCGACYQHFANPRQRRKHCLDMHGLHSCNFCTAVFKTKEKLHAHRDELDHW